MLSNGPPNLNRIGRQLMAIAMLMPLAVWGAAAWLDYRSTTAHAREYVQTTTNALAEQAREAVQFADMALDRMLEQTAGLSADELARSATVHDFLLRLIANREQLQSAFIVDASGFAVASSVPAFPIERVDNRDREYYRAALDGSDRLHVGSPLLGRLSGRMGFTVSRPRFTNGRFDGVVVVVLAPGYFRSFYETIAIDPAATSAALVRTDGVLLARYPEPARTVDRLPATHPVLTLAASGAQAGIYHAISANDGRDKLAAFRRIEGQPLIATLGLVHSAYLMPWYQHMAAMAVAALLAALALGLASRTALRRAAAEEQSLRRLLAESERREAAEAKVQLLQKMEALGRLCGGVAHDFNNLLTAILGSLELATRRAEQPDQARRLIATAAQAAERAAQLTSQMLAFARSREVTLEALDVNDVIRGSHDLLRRTADALVETTLDLDPAAWPVVADRVQLEMALLNLASNARDAMPAGGLLTVATHNVTVPPGAPHRLSPGDYVQIAMTDTGLGLDPATQERVFEPFFTTKPTGKGTGLGLSQVYGFAQQVGGSAAITSTPGEGTTVTIWLPRSHLATAPTARPAPACATLAPSSRILAVDDDDTVRQLGEEMLSELGHTVTSVPTGALAVEQLAGDTRFDLLIADYAMAGMTGVQVAAEAARLRPELPILFVTGFADTDVLSPWLARGCGLLSKPFTSAELSRAVRTMLTQPRQTNGATSRETSPMG